MAESLTRSLLDLVVRGRPELQRVVVCAHLAKRAHDAPLRVVFEEVARRVAVEADDEIDFVQHRAISFAFRLASRRRPPPLLSCPPRRSPWTPRSVACARSSSTSLGAKSTGWCRLLCWTCSSTTSCSARAHARSIEGSGRCF